MKKLVLVVLALLLLGCAQEELAADEIVEEMQKRYESISDISGEFLVKTDYGGKEETYRAKFWMKGEKYMSDDEKILTVSNGSVMWIYDKEKNEVLRMNFSSERPQFDYGMIVKGLIENYNIELLGEESVDNRECYIIKAEPKFGGGKMRMWVDKEFWYPMRMEISTEGITTVVEYRNVSFNTGLSDNMFEFTPPDGVKIVDKKFELPEKLTIDEAQQKVNFTIIVPSYTAGYEFDYAMVYGDFVQVVYSKGKDSLVITEGLKKSPIGLNWSKVDVNGREGEIAESFGIKILRTNVNGVEVVISAKLSKEEIVKIAESMV